MTKINMPSVSRAPKNIGRLLMEGSLSSVPTATGWTTTLVGSGAVTATPGYIRINSGTTASSSALATVALWGNFARFGSVVSWQSIDWAKKLYICMNIMRSNSDAQGVCRIQLKGVNTIGAAAEKSIGIRLDNLALLGESYGSSLAALDLATSLADTEPRKLVIVHSPAVPSIEWWLDNVLIGTQSTAANQPTTTSGEIYLVLSSINGAAGLVNVFLDVAAIWIYQVF